MSVKHLFEEHFDNFQHLWFKTGRYSEEGDLKFSNLYNCQKGHRKRLIYTDRKSMILHLAVAHDQFLQKIASHFFVSVLRLKLETRGELSHSLHPWEVRDRNVYLKLFNNYPRLLDKYLEPGVNPDIMAVVNIDNCLVCRQKVTGGNPLNDLSKHLLNHDLVDTMFKNVPADGPFVCNCSSRMDQLGFDRKSFLNHLVTAHGELLPRIEKSVDVLSSEIELRAKFSEFSEALVDLLGHHNLLTRIQVTIRYLATNSGKGIEARAVEDFRETMERLTEYDMSDEEWGPNEDG